MKHIWTVLCQKSSIDFETNLLSLFNCVEQLDLEIDKSKQLIENLVLPIELSLISFWIIEDSNQDNNLEMKYQLTDPNKKILNQFNYKFEIKKGSLRFRNRIHIQGLNISVPGRYTINIMQKKDGGIGEFVEVLNLPLDVNITYK